MKANRVFLKYVAIILFIIAGVMSCFNSSWEFALVSFGLALWAAA